MKYICLILVIISSSLLFSLRNWQSYTNDSHVSAAAFSDDQVYIGTWGGLLVYDKESMSLIDKYTVVDEMPSHDISDLAMSANSSELYIATRDQGVLRLKNQQFLIPLSADLGLLSEQINALAIKDSLIFVASATGLSVFLETTEFVAPLLMHNATIDNGLSESNITSVAVADNNMLYLGSTAGIDYVHIDEMHNPTAWRHAGVAQLGNNIINCLASYDDMLYVGLRTGLLVTNSDFSQIRLYSTADGLQKSSVYPIFAGTEGIRFGYGYWDSINQKIAQADTHISTLADGQITSEDILTEPATAIYGIADNYLYTCWGNGFQINNQVYTENSLSSNIITSLKVDSVSRVWTSSGHIGSGKTPRGTRGVSVLDDTQWQTYRWKDSTLFSDNVMNIAFAGGRAWFSHWYTASSAEEPWKSGVSVLDMAADEWQFIGDRTSPASLIGSCVAHVTSDIKQNIWVSSYLAGVTVFNVDIEEITRFRIPSQFIEHSQDKEDITSIHFAQDKTYIGTYMSGLVILDYDQDVDSPDLIGSNAYTWSNPLPHDLKNGRIFAIESFINEWGTEEVWFASVYGTFCYTDNNWFKYDFDEKRKKYVANNWVTNKLYFADEVRIYGSYSTVPYALAVDQDNRVWIGTKDHGISVYDTFKETFTNYTRASLPLITDNITALAFDKNTQIMYIGTEAGLNSVDLSRQADSKAKLDNTIVYPNPFKPDYGEVITIQNDTEQGEFPSGENTCTIYNLAGELILALSENSDNVFVWDGKNEAQKQCGTGIYFYVVATESGLVSRGQIALIRNE